MYDQRFLVQKDGLFKQCCTNSACMYVYVRIDVLFQKEWMCSEYPNKSSWTTMYINSVFWFCNHFFHIHITFITTIFFGGGGVGKV